MLLVLKISKTWLVLKNSDFKIAKNHFCLVHNKKTLGPIYLFSVYLLLPLHTQGVVLVINVSTPLGPLWEDLMPHGSLSRLLYRPLQLVSLTLARSGLSRSLYTAIAIISMCDPRPSNWHLSRSPQPEPLSYPTKFESRINLESRIPWLPMR